MSKPLISVIVPIFNSAPYLSECLESLRSQTLRDIEFILIDDGSTDGSSIIADAYAEELPWLFRVVHQSNSGQSQARNIGIELATGEYIGFVDSDDIACPDMFESLYRAALDGDYDHVSCNYQGFVAVDDSGEKRFTETVVGGYNGGIEGLYGRLTVGPPVHIWKRALIARTSILFPDASAYEDVAFYYEAVAYVGSTFHLNRALYYRRWHQGSLMTSPSYSGVIQFVGTARSILDFYDSRNISSTRTFYLQSALMRILLLSHMTRCMSLSVKIERDDAVRHTKKFICEELPSRSLLKPSGGFLGLYLRCFPLFLIFALARLRVVICSLKNKIYGGSK